MEDQKPKMVKVKILKYVGPHAPGEVVEMPEDQAKDVCQSSHVHDGVNPVLSQRAMLMSDYENLDKNPGDASGLTMKEMADRGQKNVVDSGQSELAQADMHLAAKAEDLNLKGLPVSSGQPFTVTGGITPPTTVIPALQNAQGRPHVSADDLKPKGKDDKKEAKKEDKVAANDKKADAKGFSAKA